MCECTLATSLLSFVSSSFLSKYFLFPNYPRFSHTQLEMLSASSTSPIMYSKDKNIILPTSRSRTGRKGDEKTSTPARNTSNPTQPTPGVPGRSPGLITRFQDRVKLFVPVRVKKANKTGKTWLSFRLVPMYCTAYRIAEDICFLKPLLELVLATTKRKRRRAVAQDTSAFTFGRSRRHHSLTHSPTSISWLAHFHASRGEGMNSMYNFQTDFVQQTHTLDTTQTPFNRSTVQPIQHNITNMKQ
ncbi:hypothetical protein BKA61DRAFT_346342 [Leptodontidium sp. MPI-SDFR-AT-0119]|nr:hypothetical protein BKA61DRAFT_346342 [Leptodontidium sp. MPI-SDFR-AT-0119]